jgi:hypothetical protein
VAADDEEHSNRSQAVLRSEAGVEADSQAGRDSSRKDRPGSVEMDGSFQESREQEDHRAGPSFGGRIS